MVKLQEPKYVFWGGELRLWDQAQLHIGCEAVTRGLNVFEGLKGYWQEDGRFGVLLIRQHYERLKRSARLLHIPFEATLETYQKSIFTLFEALVNPDRDMWVRTTLYVTEGHWGENTVADLVLTAYHQDKVWPQPIHLGVSTWRRSSDVSQPPRIKTGCNYQVARLARIEGRARGCDDMVLLNQYDRVAEATASCLLMVRDGQVITPPPSEGALESLTVNVLENMTQDLGIPFVRRPIDRTELLIADEMAICGTLHEITLVNSIDGMSFPNGSSILTALQARYREAVRGGKPHEAIEMSYLSSSHLP